MSHAIEGRQECEGERPHLTLGSLSPWTHDLQISDFHTLIHTKNKIKKDKMRIISLTPKLLCVGYVIW